MTKVIFTNCVNRSTGEIIYQKKGTYELGSRYIREKLHKQLEAALRRIEVAAPDDIIEFTIRNCEDLPEQLLF